MRLESKVLAGVVVLALLLKAEPGNSQVANPVVSFASLDSDTAATRRTPSVLRVAAYSTVGVAASGLVIGVMAYGIMMNCGDDVAGGDEGFCGALDHPQRVWAATSLLGAALGGAWVSLKAGCRTARVWGQAAIATAIVAAPTFATSLRDQKFWLAVAPLASLPLHSNLQAHCARVA